MFEFLVIVLLLIILIIVLTTKGDTKSRIVILQSKIDQLTAEIKRLNTQAPVERTVEDKPIVQQQTTRPPVIVPEPKEIVKEQPEEKLPEVTTPQKQETPVLQEYINRPPVTRKPPEPKKPGFFERNPDLEKFIGENLANKIGIGVLVLGIGYFVKYAIDQDWINEIGRVFIGICCGGLLLGVAHRMRKSFAAFSSVLVGGGIAVLYLTIAIAFHEYGIFSQTVAFILMVIITGFTILLALSYNRIELAVLAILGGFGSPFMVSTGEGNYIILFIYILILDVGMLVLAYYKKWSLVNIIAYAFTLILFGSWLATRFESWNLPMVFGALTFATLFYLIFFAMNIINNIRAGIPFKALDISLLLSNTFFYYTVGMVILSNESTEVFKGLFTAALGIFNFAFAYVLYKNQRVDRNLIFLLIGLVLTFISLAAPVQLEGNYITIFWAAEAVLLLWLSQKSGIALMRYASVIVTALMVVSLVMDWDKLYSSYASHTLSVILNKAYITGLCTIISLGFSLYLLRFEKSDTQYVTPYKHILTVLALGVLYISQYLELNHQLNNYLNDNSTIVIIVGTYNMLFIAALLSGLKRLIPAEYKNEVATLLGVIAITSFLVFYHTHFIFSRDMYVTGEIGILGFMFHYLFLALLIFISIITLRNAQTLTDFNAKTWNAYSWFFIFFFVFAASAELDHTVVLFAANDYGSIYHTLTQNHKIGFPILWGIASFILIAVGLKTKKKHLRIISLTLLLITLLKLFLFDIRGISEGGKIAAFISLGVLLLVVSFMYQRLKKLLLSDEPAEKSETDTTV